jgi:hypothetical protein
MGSCFKTKTKNRCGCFVSLICILLLIMSNYIVYFGASQLPKDKKLESSYADFDFALVVPKLTIFIGSLLLVTSIFGILAGTCKSKRNCLFVCPFILFAFASAVMLIIMAAIATGADGMVM